MEAENDDEDEPLVYEKWDAEYATQAYHQQVEALTQHQLMEEMENKAKEMENEIINDQPLKSRASGSSKRKTKKKKTKKAKFKSLKKESLSSAHNIFQEEDSVEYMSSDNEDNLLEAAPCSADVSPTGIILLKKRKKDDSAIIDEEVKITKIKFKKAKKTALVTKLASTESNLPNIPHEEDSRPAEDGGEDMELKPASRGKMGGKISIPTLPMKRIYTIKPEKPKKKGNMWSSDCLPSPDSWLPQEDAVLCALVHEYGPNWNLTSDIIYGMTAGGLYRGRFRHPILCCERFRELVQKYVHAVADTPNNEKPSTTAPAKGPLRVTEDNIRVLLDAAMEQPDRELLLQRHFTALLTSVWRMTSSLDQQRSRSVAPNHLSTSIRLFGTSVNPTAQTPTIGQSKKSFNAGHVKLITTALQNVENVGLDNSASNLMEEDPPTIEKLDVVVEFGQKESDTGDLTVGFPSAVSLSISNLDQVPPLKVPLEENHLRSSKQLAESRLRASSTACLNGVLGWASSAFPVIEPRPRSTFKSPSSGKHKLGVGESSRLPKSKVRKLMGDPTDNHSPFSEPSFQLPPSLSENNPTLTFGSYITQNLDASFASVLNVVPNDPNLGSFLSTENSEMVPHCFNPSFISGLEDCSLLEYTDIG